MSGDECREIRVGSNLLPVNECVDMQSLAGHKLSLGEPNKDIKNFFCWVNCRENVFDP